ncbi:hypothetical protein SAMN05443634_10495 [Chishuiella changwenlii]|uniref:Uncharacterized protein n=1 Tax=Chishuiella changwenlii TaxID=1434701 RepID=A0A1M6VZ13_9FLAO|nr:hypothetical protein [Chishuiella changwenlii]GGE89516.1 hypothetical protein GCM10010984_03960 [Chishuiella changwenlii]SHK86689.1 hypothetical protein SAMN05443634_10495 [Chishuiella changwenlii]
MSTDKNIIKNWFKTGLKPTQGQFWSTWDSFWHKDEKLPISNVENLENILNNKAENNHNHAQYATNDASSLNEENIINWQSKLGIEDLEMTDESVKITEDYPEFGLENGNSIKSFNSTVYSILSSDNLGSNFANTDLEVDEDRKHTGEATVDFGMPLVFSNPSQRFSGLEDKSGDATYDKILVSDNEGNINTSQLNIPINEFVKNGNGWSLKYRLNNPTFYGTLGNNAVDFSRNTSASAEISFPYGANGTSSFVIGLQNSVLGSGTFVAGLGNRSSGQLNHIVGAYSTILEERGTSNTAKYYNGIFGGRQHYITNSIESVILGGYGNKITGEQNPRLGVHNSRNAIIGGWNNEIFNNVNTNRPAYSSFILGGEQNKAQGYYNLVSGYDNYAVTSGETIFGSQATIQDTSLSGYDYIDEARIFGIGVGYNNGSGNTIRRDGLNVYRNGLVTAPTITNSLIESNSKSLITKEYLDHYKTKVFYPSTYNHTLNVSDISRNKTFIAYTLDSSGNITLDSSGFIEGQEIIIMNLTNDVDVTVSPVNDGGDSILLQPTVSIHLVYISGGWNYIKEFDY